MTDQEAIVVCRNRDRSLRDAKRALDWAAQAPSADKIQPLLLLNSEAFAARKRISDRLEAVLAQCANANTEPLWQTVEHDWELDRHYLAFRVLMKLPGIDVARFLALAERRLPEWNWMQNWAGQRGVPIAAEIVERQAAWSKELEPGGGDYNVYVELAARRAEWPAEQDLLPPAVVAASPRRAGIRESTTDLTADLDRILAWLGQHLPEAQRNLAPGLTADEVAALAAGLPFVLPAEVVELYRWRNGSAPGREVVLVPNYWFLPLGEAVERYRVYSGVDGWKKNWFPLFDWNGDSVILAACGKPEAAAISAYDFETGTRRLTKSLAELIRKTADGYAAGRYRVGEYGQICGNL